MKNGKHNKRLNIVMMMRKIMTMMIQKEKQVFSGLVERKFGTQKEIKKEALGMKLKDLNKFLKLVERRKKFKIIKNIADMKISKEKLEVYKRNEVVLVVLKKVVVVVLIKVVVVLRKVVVVSQVLVAFVEKNNVIVLFYIFVEFI